MAALVAGTKGRSPAAVEALQALLCSLLLPRPTPTPARLPAARLPAHLSAGSSLQQLCMSSPSTGEQWAGTCGRYLFCETCTGFQASKGVEVGRRPLRCASPVQWLGPQPHHQHACRMICMVVKSPPWGSPATISQTAGRQGRARQGQAVGWGASTGQADRSA